MSVHLVYREDERKLHRYIQHPCRKHVAVKYWQPFGYIVVYACCQRYGGPEEGGWYYNHYSAPVVMIRIRSRWTRKKIRAQIGRACRLAAHTTEAEHELDIQWHFERIPGEQTTKVKPHYE